MAILELSGINNTEYRANTEGRFEKLFLQKTSDRFLHQGVTKCHKTGRCSSQSKSKSNLR